MVDAMAGEPIRPQVQDQGALRDAEAHWAKASPALLEAYRRFAAPLLCGPAQHPDWVDAAAVGSAVDLVILTLQAGGETVAMLPLEIVRKRGITIARAIGGHHANTNFLPCRPAARPKLTRPVLERAFKALRQCRPEVDLVLIERHAPALDGVANPLQVLPRIESPNVALAVDLSGGFEGLIDRIGRKRRMKKHRNQTRKLEASGGFRRIEAHGDEEVSRLLHAFLQMKSERFRKQGITDTFAGTRPFWHRLFAGRNDPARPFLLHGLEVGGVLRAVTGSSIVGNRIICEFSAFTEDELTSASPGDFLFFQNIEEAARKGFTVFDFSVGDEPYKRVWCDLETRQFDTILPLSAKGSAYSLTLRGLGEAKRRVKASPRLWNLARKLRSLKSRGVADTPVEDVD